MLEGQRRCGIASGDNVQDLQLLRKRFRNLSLLAFVAVASVSCGQENVDDIPSGSATTVECQEEPMSSELRDANGVLQDVRIFQFGDQRLYVPTAWMGKGLFVDKIPGQISNLATGLFDPDLRTDDCPGIVYRATNADESSNSLLPMVGIRFDGIEKPEGLTADTIKAIFFARNVKREDDSRFNAALGGGFYTTYFVASDDVFVFISDIRRYPPGGVESRSIAEFVDWLSTPPSSRDNTKSFNLEIDTETIDN